MMMKKTLLLLLALMIGSLQLTGQDLSGRWQGRLGIPGGSLRLELDVIQQEGSWKILLHSPDQGARDIPTTSVVVKGDSLAFAQPNLGILYRGRVSPSGELVGQFSQGSFTAELRFKRGAAKPIVRVQEPKAPLPYEEREVSFDAGASGVKLSGTLTLPRAGAPHPLVILATGSGPQNRDEELMGHKPFLVLADSLTRAGYAVLRYDDRGVGKSTGSFATSLTTDFADDLEAALRYSLTLKEVNKQRIWLMGHSEGAVLAAMVAARTKVRLAGIALIAGPVKPLLELMLDQGHAVLERSFAGREHLLALLTPIEELNQRLYTAAADETIPTEALIAKFDELYRTSSLHAQLQEWPSEDEADRKSIERSFREQSFPALTSPYMRALLRIKPQDYLSRVRCPVVAIFGEVDMQVDRSNFDELKRLLPKAKATLLAHHNHLMQPAETGFPDEYARIEITFSSEAMQALLSLMREAGKR